MIKPGAFLNKHIDILVVLNDFQFYQSQDKKFIPETKSDIFVVFFFFTV